jgi:hypothetical protein
MNDTRARTPNTNAAMLAPRTEESTPYARVVSASKRVRWDIDHDVIRERTVDLARKLMPDGLSLATRLPFLDAPACRFFSQVQGRTYANMFGLIERFVNAKVLDHSRRHFFGDQIALEAMVRFSDEELKHQELFRRIERLAAHDMRPGHRFTHDANAVAGVVLGKSTWSVLALICFIELVTQVHFKESIQPDEGLCPLFKDVFRFHWMEESQHAILDELEWEAENAKIAGAERDQAVTDLIDLVGAVDGLVSAQAADDAAYFLEHMGSALDDAQREEVRATFVAAYRYQYILSGVEHTRFPTILRNMLTDAQYGRVVASLAALSS